MPDNPPHVYLSAAAAIDPTGPEKLAATRTFQAMVDVVYQRGVVVGRRRACADIRDAIEAAKPSVRQFWDTADAARVYALNDAAKIADRIAEDVPDAG